MVRDVYKLFKMPVSSSYTHKDLDILLAFEASFLRVMFRTMYVYHGSM